MAIVVTGAAGFIGFHVASALLAAGEEVVGVDNVNDYYDVRLKEARLARLAAARGFRFHRLDIADWGAMRALAADDVVGIVHLAAQAGVRYSLVNPFAYGTANVMGQIVMLELARRCANLRHFVYASSSSVYGGNAKHPFSIADRVDRPVSLYAATKRSGELIAESYAHLYRVPMTGLRFFTVYGPWGRPDMAAYIFTEAIVAGRPIQLFNRGDLKRDFTFVDDIVEGVLAALARPPRDDGAGSPHRLYNLGNNRTEPLRRFVDVLERAIGRKARIELAPMQPGDVYETYADIADSIADLGFRPRTTIDEGLPRFVAWYRDYHGVKD
jgi:UDP-glucuronate 4-epimerase